MLLPLTEEVFKKNVTSLEEIYAILIKGDSNAGREAELRVAMIDIMSTLEASIIGEKDNNKGFIELLDSARDIILEWDPYGQWFRHEKKLVDIVYKVIVQTKSVVFSQTKSNGSEASKIKNELAALKSELNDLRSLMNNLTKNAADITKSSSQQSEETVVPEISVEESETPIILPTEIVEEAKEEIKEPTKESSSSVEPLVEDIEEEEASFQANATIQKLSEETNPETAPGTVLSQMKSIISEAEDETERQISSLKEQFTQEEKSISSEEVKADSPTIPTIPEKNGINQTENNTTQTETKDEESLVKPSEILKQQESISSQQSVAGTDPYMQLLTLEAEKYRLEKQMEKNETDFQEGLKSKLEFDENIQLINKELTIIREQIASLRKQLTS